MFSTKEDLEKRTGPYGVGRFSYLQSLVTEYQDTTSEEAKLQVLANLANFAYDPINYEYLRRLNVIDLFLDCLTEPNQESVEFGIGGLCNLCLDKNNKAYILDNDGVTLVSSCLSNDNENTVLSAITALMYLVTPASKADITSPQIIDAMLRFSESSNPRISNLAQVFLADYCSDQQVSNMVDARKKWEEGVNLVAAQSLRHMKEKEGNV